MIERVRVGGLDVAIVTDETVEGFGEWWESKQVIRVAPGLPARILAATILHEVLHAVGDAYGVSLPERVVRVLEQSLVGMVRADPEGAQRWIEAVVKDNVP